MSNATRTEHDLLGDKAVPADAYYGVQTARALENFAISGVPLSLYPNLIKALAMVKMAAARQPRVRPVRQGRPDGHGGRLPGADRRQAPRRVPPRRLPGRCRHLDQHERQRGDRQPRAGADGPSEGRVHALRPARSRQLLPIHACIFEAQTMFINAVRTLRVHCVEGITVNEDICRHYVEYSIGVVTALNPVIGYEPATELAAEAMKTGRGIMELVREKEVLTEQQIAEVLDPAAMTGEARR